MYIDCPIAWAYASRDETSMNETFSLRDKQTLSGNLDNYFESVENLRYRVMSVEHRDYLITESKKIKAIDEIRNFWAMKTPAEIKNLKDTEFYCLNGHNLRVNAKYQKARFKHGFWLEMSFQLVCRKLGIDFIGNSSNLNHFPHTLGIFIDVETEHLLIECTNLTKWLRFEWFQEKINYFFKNDPEHKKKWVLVTTFLKAIPLKIRRQIENNNITLLLTNQTANSRNFHHIADLLYKPLLDLNNQAINDKLNRETVKHRINKLFFTHNHKNNELNLTLTNRCLNSESNRVSPEPYVWGVGQQKNMSGLDG